MALDVPADKVCVVVMGVSGSGKTTVGRALAHRLGWTFVDADDYHSAAAIAKMRQSTPLTAEDRRPWIGALIARLNSPPMGRVVLACSALTHAIRQRLRDETVAEVVFVYLALDRVELLARLTQRQGHYAQAALLVSQLETLETPRHALVVDAQASPEVLCERILEQLALDRPDV